jgi:hypothetical protein
VPGKAWLLGLFGVDTLVQLDAARQFVTGDFDANHLGAGCGTGMGCRRNGGLRRVCPVVRCVRKKLDDAKCSARAAHRFAFFLRRRG